MRLVRSGLIALLSLNLMGACSKEKSGAGDAGADAKAAVGADASAEAGSGEDVQPVYPIEANAPPVPIAEKLCNAMTSLPEKKRAACCNTTPGVVITAECTRTLSAAIRHAALALDEKAVDACIAAFDKTLEGCDWVGPFSPGPPPACQGIFTGKLAAGAKCRSSLECASELRCLGLGPTTIGTCGAAGETGASCGGTVDSLATYTRQTDVDKQHPECKERCIKRKCAAPLPERSACLISADCQPGLSCLVATNLPKTIVPIKVCAPAAPPANEGEPCPGGTCDGALQCIRGKCAMRKAGGEACTDDFECRGGCLKDGGTKGTCGSRCDIR